MKFLIAGGVGFIDSASLGHVVKICNGRWPLKKGGGTHSVYAPCEKFISFVIDRAGHDFRYAIDFTKIKKELGRKPSVSFEEGLEKMVKWFLK